MWCINTIYAQQSPLYFTIEDVNNKILFNITENDIQIVKAEYGFLNKVLLKSDKTKVIMQSLSISKGFCKVWLNKRLVTTIPITELHSTTYKCPHIYIRNNQSIFLLPTTIWIEFGGRTDDTPSCNPQRIAELQDKELLTYIRTKYGKKRKRKK